MDANQLMQEKVQTYHANFESQVLNNFPSQLVPVNMAASCDVAILVLSNLYLGLFARN